MRKVEYGLGDIVEMKKQHPCGTNRWQITRMGADIKIKCTGCDHVVMMRRSKFDKMIKKVLVSADDAGAEHQSIEHANQNVLGKSSKKR